MEFLWGKVQENIRIKCQIRFGPEPLVINYVQLEVEFELVKGWLQGYKEEKRTAVKYRSVLLGNRSKSSNYYYNCLVRTV